MHSSGLLSETVEVIDNFLDEELFGHIQREIGSANFPWYYNSSNIHGTNSGKIDADGAIPYQFTHTLYHDGIVNSTGYEMMLPVFDCIGVTELFRAKLNLGPVTETHVRGGFHYDVQNPDDSFDSEFYGWKIALLYLNTNNGYTELGDGQTFTSVENRLLRFPASTLHTGVSQTDNQVRVVLNVLYK